MKVCLHLTSLTMNLCGQWNPFPKIGERALDGVVVPSSMANTRLKVSMHQSSELSGLRNPDLMPLWRKKVAKIN